MLEVAFRMRTSKDEESKSMSNSGFEDEVSFEFDEDETLCSSWDARSKVVKRFSQGQACVVRLSDDKVFLKNAYFPVECEKIVSKFTFFSRKDSVFKVCVSAHFLIDGAPTIAGKERPSGFTFKVDTLLNI